MGEGEGGRLGSGVGFEGVSLLLRLVGVKKKYSGNGIVCFH